MLLAVMSHNGPNIGALIYYSITYGLSTLGAFGVVLVVQQQTGGESLPDFAGLCRRAPALSLCMMVFMLSLAGIPPLAGFFGKFYVFAAALNTDPKNLGLLWLVIVAIAMSAVSLYYYLQVLKQIYVADGPTGSAQGPALIPTQVVLGVVALAIVVLGCAPDLLVQQISLAVKSVGF